MRPIDADKLKENVESLFCEKCHERGGAFCMDCALNYLIQYSDKLPTLTLNDLQPKGEWKIMIDDYDCEFMECSVCGEGFYDGDNDTIDRAYNYCPNCGHPMEAGGK